MHCFYEQTTLQYNKLADHAIYYCSSTLFQFKRPDLHFRSWLIELAKVSQGKWRTLSVFTLINYQQSAGCRLF